MSPKSDPGRWSYDHDDEAPGPEDDRRRLRGIARRYGWRTSRVRLLFVLSCLLPGPQFVLYLILWWMMPKQY